MTCLLSTFFVGGCFSEPPSTADSDDASTSNSAASSSTSTERGTSTTDGDGTTFVSSSTDHGSSSTSWELSSSETTEGSPEPSFCVQPDNAGALLCTDFDAPNPDDWPEGRAFGYTRTVQEEPIAFSEPRFMRLSRNNEVSNGDPVQALFEGEDIDLGMTAGLDLQLVFRLPPDVDVLCDGRGLRLFSFEYPVKATSSSLVRVAGSVSETNVTLTRTDEIGTTTVLGTFEDVHGPAMAGWRTLRVRLAASSSAGGEAIDVVGSLGGTGVVSIPNFEPPDGIVLVTVGPSFDPGLQPPNGCNYDLDNLVLRAIPPE